MKANTPLKTRRKRTPRRSGFWAGAALAGMGFFGGSAGLAAAVMVSFEFTHLNLAIPDGNGFGVTDSRTIATPYETITGLEVSLAITGGFNGDLYVHLEHGSGLAVLLNRVGRTADNPVGYTDAGMDVIFRDDAPNGDIHLYRFTLSGNHGTPLGDPLTGVWAPDGRSVNPFTATDASPRTALLSSFAGLDPNGEWRLFLADLDPGGQSQLQSWGLHMALVPEPRHTVFFPVVILAVALLWRHLRAR